MNEADRREKTMLDLFDWITDFVADRDDVTADDIRLAIAREFADGPRERDVLLAQYRERAEAAVRRLKGFESYERKDFCRSNARLHGRETAGKVG